VGLVRWLIVDVKDRLILKMGFVRTKKPFHAF
jgi:hypothetical protein